MTRRTAILFALFFTVLVTERLEATTFTRITADSTRESDPTPSPDGKWLAFTSDRCGKGSTQIYIMPIQGGEARQLTTEPESARAATPTWAPDGRSLLFVSTRGKRWNVYSMPFEGGDAKLLSHSPGGSRFATYSANGKKIAFYSNRIRPTDLYGYNIFVMDSGGESETEMARQVTNSSGSPGHPTWSSDAKWIAYVAKETNPATANTMEGNIIFAKFHVFKVAAEGGEEVRLSKGVVDGQSTEETWPSWSPDGKWIAFGRQIGTKSDVWVLDVATRQEFPITKSGDCRKPTWSYDGRSIYYSVLDGTNEDLWVAKDLTLRPPPKKSTTSKSKPKSTTAPKTGK